MLLIESALKKIEKDYVLIEKTSILRHSPGTLTHAYTIVSPWRHRVCRDEKAKKSDHFSLT